ncbi:MAG TPA: DUF1688 family protein, partial [Archangium sp.]
MPEASATVAYLRGPRAIRERCRALLELGIAGKLKHFRVDMARVPAVADYVLDVTR